MLFRSLVCASALVLIPGLGQAACLPVGDDPALTISDQQRQILDSVSFARADLFDVLQATSEYETSGCWAAPVGNFDAQTLSVGILQWNYGQNSVQGLMNAYRASFATPEAFGAEVSTLMPQFGRVAFGEDCLATPLQASCKEKILAAHAPDGKLGLEIAGEYEALFNSPVMRQIQVDSFIAFLNGLTPKLNQTFGAAPTRLQTRWGVDLAIQQGYVKYTDPVTVTEQSAFLNPADVISIRRITASLTPDQRRNRMMSTIRWYAGLCGSVYQGVVAEQCNYNIKHWCAVARHGVSDEQFDLFTLTAVRSRIATGQSGRWQANAFARRTKIVLDTGQVGAKKLELPTGVRRTSRCNNMLVKD
jgi:hypothetical protein